MKEFMQLTDAEKLLVRAMFHPTREGYSAYLYEVSRGGWVISRKRKPKPLSRGQASA